MITLLAVFSWLSSTTASDLLKVLGGLATPIAGAFFTRLYVRYRYRKVRRFWKWFIGQSVSIVMTEYRAIGNDVDSQFARRAGGGYLVSRGNALAMSTLQQFLSAEVTSKNKVSVVGDKSAAPSTEHVVVIGSPANNGVSNSLFQAIASKLELPWRVAHNAATGDIYFESRNGNKRLTPDIDDGFGTDYAMIIRARLANPTDRYVIILAGAFMYGSQAAADAITNRQVIDYVAKRCRGADDVMVLMRVGVNHSTPLAPEVDFDGEDHVYTLTRTHVVAQVKAR